MLVKPTEDEGEVSERPSESQLIPSPTHPKGSGGNHRGQSSSDRSQSGIEDGLTLQTWIKSLSMKKRLARKKKMESVFKQGRKTFKSEPTVHKDLAFDDLDDAMDYIEIEDAHDDGTVKNSEEKRVSTKDQVSTTQPQPKVSTDKPKVSTNKLDEGTAEPNDGNSDESDAPTTVFRDDETIAQFLVTMSQNKTKQKGVEIKEIKDTDRPRTTTERSILTLNPLPKIDPKDKGKKVLEEKAESDAEPEGVNEVERKFAQLMMKRWPERFKRNVKQKRRKRSWLRKKLLKLHSPMSMTIFRQDSMQMRFLLKNFKNKREKSSPLNREPSCFMIQLKKKFDQSFIPIDSAEDERQIREMNKKTTETDTSKKRKSGSRVKRIFKRRMTDFNEEEKEKLKSFLNVEPDEDKAINYEVLQTRFPIVEWESKFYDYGHYGRELIYYRVIRADGSSRWIKTFSEMVKLFDRMKLVEIHSLVMKRFATTTSEDDELWKNKEEWNLLSREFHEQLFTEKQIAELENLRRLSIHLVVYNEELAIPEQTATGKGISNPLMAGSLPKTTKST
ncbi:hypothetical protein Tco_0222265 [Tanacetum coccineum]